MYAAIQLNTEEYRDYRNGKRYSANGYVEVILDGSKFASAELINISKSGVAIKCFRHLPVGSDCRIEIAGLGEFSCSVVRQMSGAEFGLEFNMTHIGQRSLENRLEHLFTGTSGPEEILVMATN